jgi:hypothetical protein
MTDNADESGKGPNRPGDAPRRPHATIDLKATEVGGSRSKSGFRFADRLRVMRRLGGSALGSNSFLSHVAAGVAGAILTLVVAGLFGLFSGSPSASSGVPTDVAGGLRRSSRRQPSFPPAQPMYQTRSRAPKRV